MFIKKVISKSKFLNGLQCLKYLWYSVNSKESIPEPDETTQYIFNQGHLVGQYAKKLFPDGIEVGYGGDFKNSLRKSRDLLTEQKPLFEAGFSYEKPDANFPDASLYARADILNPAGNGQWDIIEVKSSTSAKEINIGDIAFQKYCYKGAGLKVRKCYLMYVNNQYIREGDIEPAKLFTKSDITEEVEEFTIGIEEKIKEMFATIFSGRYPDIKVGRQCDSPYPCPLKDECWFDMPENNVFNLYSGKIKASKLFSKGIVKLKDIPDEFNLDFKQKIQVESERTKEPVIDKNNISIFLKKLQFPLYFLDFETFSTAIPFYNRTSPYQRIPFQFSLHLLDSLDVTPRHFSFLADGKGDPRKDLLEYLKDNIGDSGSIVVYYKSFEKSLLKELAESFNEYYDWVSSIILRIVDLYEPFGRFYYYNYKQKGSASIKNVLPAITDISYEGLDIANGLSASISFLSITHGNFSDSGTVYSPQEVARVRQSLEEYCKLDTEGLIYILRKLKNLAGNG